MITRRSSVLFAVVILVPVIILLLFVVTTRSAAMLSAAPSPAPTATAAPCPTIVYEVVASLEDATVTVGDEFVLRSTSGGYAGLAETRLYMETRLAAIPELDVFDVPPVIEVLPTSTGSTLGSAEFVLRAINPGTIRLRTEVYGDAYFYSQGPDGECYIGTTFKLIRSEQVTLSVAPAPDD